MCLSMHIHMADIDTHCRGVSHVLGPTAAQLATAGAEDLGCLEPARVVAAYCV